MTGGRVAILGPTGRNFAAGMSGGLAYVLDPERTLAARINPTLADQIEALDEADAIELHDLVAEHAERTGSAVAEGLLDDWEAALTRFVKVVPADYKRVLAELAAEEDSHVGDAPRADEFKDEVVDVVGAPHARTGEGE